MTKLHNVKALLDNRRTLRKNPTPAEKYLWDILKTKPEGRRFRRQHSVGSYILDFYCAAEKLAIELDGEGHFTDDGLKYDAERTAFLEECDIKVIRFENYMVLQQTDLVIEKIKACFKK